MLDMAIRQEYVHVASILIIGDDFQKSKKENLINCHFKRSRPHSCMPNHSSRAVKLGLKSKLYDMIWQY